MRGRRCSPIRAFRWCARRRMRGCRCSRCPGRRRCSRRCRSRGCRPMRSGSSASCRRRRRRGPMRSRRWRSAATRWCSTSRRAGWCETLRAMAEAFGYDRPAAVALELTKRFERRLSRDARRACCSSFEEFDEIKGEAVILVGGAPERVVDEAGWQRGARGGARGPAAARRGRRDHRQPSGSSARTSTMPPSPSKPKSNARHRRGGLRPPRRGAGGAVTCG